MNDVHDPYESGSHPIFRNLTTRRVRMAVQLGTILVVGIATTVMAVSVGPATVIAVLLVGLVALASMKVVLIVAVAVRHRDADRAVAELAAALETHQVTAQLELDELRASLTATLEAHERAARLELDELRAEQVALVPDLALVKRTADVVGTRSAVVEQRLAALEDISSFRTDS